MRPALAPRPAAAPWMRRVLLLAGAYNLLWGAAVVLLPVGWTIGWTGVEVGTPAIWRCVGMIVGAYGVGYLCAARRPLRHWPITLVGLLGKTFGPIGFVVGAARGELPWAMGLTILFNDLIWWPFFAAILYRAADRFAYGEPGDPAPLEAALENAVDGRGLSLQELSGARPRLVVAVRHSGCTFCRQELAALSAERGAIEAAGASPVVVTLSSREDAEALVNTYGLGDVPVICDPGRTLYRALELGRGDAQGVVQSPRLAAGGSGVREARRGNDGRRRVSDAGRVRDLEGRGRRRPPAPGRQRRPGLRRTGGLGR